MTAESSVGRPPVAKALSQRCAIASTSLSWMQAPHGLPSVEDGEGWARVRVGRKQTRRVCMYESFMIGIQEESCAERVAKGSCNGEIWMALKEKEGEG